MNCKIYIIYTSTTLDLRGEPDDFILDILNYSSLKLTNVLILILAHISNIYLKFRLLM